MRIYEKLSFHDKPLSEVNMAFRRWGMDLSKRGDIVDLIKTIGRHLRNTFWYIIDEKTVEGVPLLFFQCFELWMGFISA